MAGYLYNTKEKTLSIYQRVLETLTASSKPITYKKYIIHLRRNYQSVHIKHRVDLVNTRHKQSKKNMTVKCKDTGIDRLWIYESAYTFNDDIVLLSV